MVRSSVEGGTCWAVVHPPQAGPVASSATLGYCSSTKYLLPPTDQEEPSNGLR